MALMSRTITAGTSRKLVKVNLILSESHPDDYISNNYSRINYSVTITRGDKTWDTSWSGWGKKIYFNFSIGGNNYGPIYVPQYNYGGNNPPGTTFASGHVDIAHNADGTKSIDASISFTDTANGNNNGSYYTPGNGSNSASGLVLETIPRASSISVPSSVTTGSASTLTITRASDSFTHYLYWKIGDVTGEISGGVGTSYSWTPAHSIFTNYPNSSSNCDITIVCDTYNGNTYIGSKSVATKINLNSSVIPTVSSSGIQDGNATVRGKNWGIYIKGKSYVNITSLTASGVQGSSISSYVCVMEGATYTASSLSSLNAQIKNVNITTGSKTAVLYVIDSRGRSSTQYSKSYTVVDYADPVLNVVSVERCTSNGTVSDNGTYVKVSFSGNISSCNSHNPMTVKIAFKEQSASSYPSGNYTTYYNAVTNASSFDFTGSNSKIIGGGNIDLSKTYIILMQVTDGFLTNERTKPIGTQFDLIHYHSSGRSIAFGKKSEATSSQSKAEFNFPDGIIFNNTNLLSFLSIPICVGTQVIYDGITGSGTCGKTALLGAYGYSLIDRLENNITCPSGFHFEYRLHFQSTNNNSGGIICYLNNIATDSNGTWSGETFRTIASSRLFRKTEISLETTMGYSNNGTNLYYESTTPGNWKIYNISISIYIVKD